MHNNYMYSHKPTSISTFGSTNSTSFELQATNFQNRVLSDSEEFKRPETQFFPKLAHDSKYIQ